MYSINMDWTPGVCQALEISSEFRNPFMVAYVFVVEKTITTVCRMVIRAMEQYNAEKEGKRRGYSIKQDDQRRLWRWAKTERSFEWTMWIIRRSWGNKCNALRVQLCSRNSQEALDRHEKITWQELIYIILKSPRFVPDWNLRLWCLITYKKVWWPHTLSLCSLKTQVTEEFWSPWENRNLGRARSLVQFTRPCSVGQNWDQGLDP